MSVGPEITATGQGRISYGFSPIDQVTSITQSAQTSTFVYDGLGRMSKRTLPNGVSTDWAFDSAGFLGSVISKRNGVTFDSHIYGRDPVGNILQENRNGTLDTFGYNDLYEITSANVGGLQYLWQYDGLGNRLRQDKGFQRTDYSYDAANCVLIVGGATVTHDPNGNVTGYGGDTYTWDVRGRLVKLTRTGLTVEFTYDPFGNRTSKKVNGVLTKFLLDGDSVVSEVTGATTVNTLQGPTLDEPLARNGRYFTPQHLGSTTTLTDGAGSVVQSYLYGPFGDVTASTAESNPFQYAGRENDGTGLYYNRRRYYVPEWGRFLSEDPIGLAGGLNQYVYAHNNPLHASDPSGTSDEWNGFVGVLLPTDILPWDRWKELFRLGAALGVAVLEVIIDPSPPLPIGPPVLTDKLEYLYGHAAGKPGDHNFDRSQQMRRQLERIGLPESAENRAYITQQLEAVYRDPLSIARVQSNGRVVRESLLIGPKGGAKMQTIWDGNRLISVILYGG